MLKLKLLLASSLGLILSFHAHATDRFEKELTCFQHLNGKAEGPDYVLGNGSVMIPGKKGRKRGFYTFTSRTVFFCRFPESPAEEGENHRIYYLKVFLGGQSSLDDKPSFYMLYGELKDQVMAPTFTVSSSPLGSEHYEGVECFESQTEGTSGLLTSELTTRIGKLRSSFESARAFQKNAYQVVLGSEYYIEALENCKLVGGPVAVAATEELLKFPTVPVERPIFEGRTPETIE